MTGRSDSRNARRTPAGSGATVVVVVLVLIAAVLLTQRIPHALRPTLRQPAVPTVGSAPATSAHP